MESVPDFKVTISQHTQQHASSRLKAFRSASSKVCWTVWMVKSCQIDLTHQALLLATTQQLHLRQLQLAWVRESSKSHRLLKMPPEIVPTCHLCIFMPLLRFHSCKNEGVTFGSSTRPAGTVWAAAPDTDLTSTGYQSYEALGKIVTEYHGSIWLDKILSRFLCLIMLPLAHWRIQEPPGQSSAGQAPDSRSTPGRKHSTIFNSQNHTKITS